MNRHGAVSTTVATIKVNKQQLTKNNRKTTKEDNMNISLTQNHKIVGGFGL